MLTQESVTLTENQTEKRLDRIFGDVDRDILIDRLFQRIELKTFWDRWLSLAGNMWWDWYVLGHPVWKIAWAYKLDRPVVAIIVSDYDLLLDRFGGKRRVLWEVCMAEMELAKLEGRHWLTPRQVAYVKRVYLKDSGRVKT